jgi:hypothetical protein
VAPILKELKKNMNLTFLKILSNKVVAKAQHDYFSELWS